MSKRELIDAIRTHNRTVSPEFLSRFAEPDLQAYLDRVSDISLTDARPAAAAQPAHPPSIIGVTAHAKNPFVLLRQQSLAII